MMTAISFGGPWTEQKLQILRRYLDAYTTALKNQPFTLTYLDAFAGSGYWTSESSYSSEDYDDFRDFLEGSAAIALGIDDKPFDELVFMEKIEGRTESLRKLAASHANRRVRVVNEDANQAIPRFCAAMRSYDRAVTFLDPYATQVNWSTVKLIAETERIDCWILFPLMAISRMMPTNREPGEALALQLDRIFGGREHWQRIYHRSEQLHMFSDAPRFERARGAEPIADLYRERLRGIFAAVAPTRCTLLNSNNSPMFELFFAASNSAGAGPAIRIADHILKAW